MSRVLITPQADLDVFEIALYIAEDDPGASERFLESLREKLDLLGGSRRMGRAREELARGLRSFPIGSYVLFYRPIPGGIELVRVLSGARDIDSLF